MLNKCIETGRIVKEWKEGTTIQLHKKGDELDLTNYRQQIFTIQSLSSIDNFYVIFAVSGIWNHFISKPQNFRKHNPEVERFNLFKQFGRGLTRHGK